MLEASLRNNVPHASVCGGRARCSTCRIRIIGDCSALPEPSQREAFVLQAEGGLSIDEVASATGVGAETAKTRLRYAKARLRTPA